MTRAGGLLAALSTAALVACGSAMAPRPMATAAPDAGMLAPADRRAEIERLSAALTAAPTRAASAAPR